MSTLLHWMPDNSNCSSSSPWQTCIWLNRNSVSSLKAFWSVIFHLSGEIWAKKLEQGRVRGLDQVHLEVHLLLHLLLHVGEREYAEGRAAVHPHQVVVVGAVLGQRGVSPACPNLQGGFPPRVEYKLCPCCRLHPCQPLLQLQEEFALHPNFSQPSNHPPNARVHCTWIQGLDMDIGQSLVDNYKMMLKSQVRSTVYVSPLSFAILSLEMLWNFSFASTDARRPECCNQVSRL